MKNNTIAIIVLVALLVGVGGFFGGMKFQETKASSPNSADHAQGNFRGQNGQGNRFQGGFRPVVGEILSLDDKSITVKLDDGSSKIVLLPDNLTVSKTDSASKADLKTGVSVGVFGTNNSDGSVTAQNVQINPMFRNGQGGIDHRGSPSESPR